MLKAGRLLVALSLGALAPFALPAQNPTDLADVCKVLGDAKPGQWASFDGTGSSGVGKLRLAVVGSERAGDSTWYWFEVSFAGKDPGKSGVVQILTGSLASGLESPRALVFKVGPQPAMRISGEMAGMMGKQGGQNAAALSGPVKSGGVLSPLLAHHPGHLTGDPHRRLRAHLEDERARRLEPGRETAGEDLHDAALAGILAGEAHLEPVQRRVARPLRSHDRQAQLSHPRAAGAVERRPLTGLRVSQDLADVRQVGRALSGARERREGEREYHDQCAEPVHQGILQELVSATHE